MKKTLSVILAVILMFSAVSVMAFAEESDSDLPKVSFYISEDDLNADTVYYTLQVVPEKPFVDRLQDEKSGLITPTMDSTETTKYIFEHWAKYEMIDGVWTDSGEYCYTSNVPPVAKGVEEVRYVAEFKEKDIKATQSFWAFVQSIFARINVIFEYFAKVFEGVIEF